MRLFLVYIYETLDTAEHY